MHFDEYTVPFFYYILGFQKYVSVWPQTKSWLTHKTFKRMLLFTTSLEKREVTTRSKNNKFILVQYRVEDAMFNAGTLCILMNVIFCNIFLVIFSRFLYKLKSTKTMTEIQVHQWKNQIKWFLLYGQKLNRKQTNKVGDLKALGNKQVSAYLPTKAWEQQR